MQIPAVLLVLLLVALAVAPQTPATPEAQGTVLQIMRGILYPASNIIFDAQSEDPEAPADPSPFSAGPHRPFDGPFGGWEAVENSGIALAEAANLLTISGRACANGRAAPVDEADWMEWVVDLRETGTAAYEAAQSRNPDAILAVSDQMTEACAKCHDKYRDVDGDLADRCMP